MRHFDNFKGYLPIVEQQDIAGAKILRKLRISNPDNCIGTGIRIEFVVQREVIALL